MIEIPKIAFNIYGIMLIASLVLGFVMFSIILHRRGVPKEYIFYSVLLSFFLVVIVGFELTIIQIGRKNFIENPSMSSMGCAIGAIIASFIMDLIFGFKYRITDAQIRTLPLIYSVAKIGCFFAGCCRGIPYDGFGCVVYSSEGPTSYLPVQLIETIVFMIVFVLGITLLRKKNAIIIVIASMLFKTLLDFGRISNGGRLGFTQAVCIVVAIVMLIADTVFTLFRNKKHADTV